MVDPFQFLDILDQFEKTAISLVFNHELLLKAKIFVKVALIVVVAGDVLYLPPQILIFLLIVEIFVSEGGQKVGVVGLDFDEDDPGLFEELLVLLDFVGFRLYHYVLPLKVVFKIMEIIDTHRFNYIDIHGHNESLAGLRSWP